MRRFANAKFGSELAPDEAAGDEAPAAIGDPVPFEAEPLASPAVLAEAVGLLELEDPELLEPLR